MSSVRATSQAAQLSSTFGLEDVEYVGRRYPDAGTMSRKQSFVTRMLLPEPVRLPPADLVELDAVADDVAVGELQLIRRIQHLRLEKLQLKRYRQTLGGSPRPNTHEHFPCLEESPGYEMLETVEIGAAVGIAFLDPLSPEIVQGFPLIRLFKHRGRLDASADEVGSEAFLRIDRVAVGGDEVARALAQRVAGVANECVELCFGGWPALEATGGLRSFVGGGHADDGSAGGANAIDQVQELTQTKNGVYVDGDQGPEFVPAPPLTDDDVQQIVQTSARRIIRLCMKRGLLDDAQADPLADEEPVLAAITAASVRGLIATGERTGQRLRRVLRDPATGVRTAPLCLAARGFSLHAATRIAAADRLGLERLCRYVARPALAAGRLRLLDGERLSFALKTPWSNGTTHLLLSPLELLEKLAALVPPPRLNLIRYHGILAPSARDQIVPGAADEPEGTCASDRLPCAHRLPWGQLLARLFAIDVTTCPD